jgi:hypothetical protein
VAALDIGRLEVQQTIQLAVIPCCAMMSPNSVFCFADPKHADLFRERINGGGSIRRTGAAVRTGICGGKDRFER